MKRSNEPILREQERAATGSSSACGNAKERGAHNMAQSLSSCSYPCLRNACVESSDEQGITWDLQGSLPQDEDDNDVVLVSVNSANGSESVSGSVMLNLQRGVRKVCLKENLHEDFKDEREENQNVKIVQGTQRSEVNTDWSQANTSLTASVNFDIKAMRPMDEVAFTLTCDSPVDKNMSNVGSLALRSDSKDKARDDVKHSSESMKAATSVCGKKCNIALETAAAKGRSFDEAPDADTSSSDATLNQSTTSSMSMQKPNVSSKLHSLESRPIYPNVPYSPYASPYGSPRSNRRRPPLRESRRISIEQTGSFLQLNQYKLMDQIGQGSYGLVKLAYSEEDSTHYAMKILSKRRLLRQAGLMRRGPKKTTSPLDRVYREIAVLKKLDHPNVVKLVEVLDDPMEDSLYMVFELVKQGEVLSIPTDNPLSGERAWSVFRETLLGLEYLHYQRIIHGDLKPDNLLLTECGHVKIADLGVCNEFLGEDATMSNGTTAGTPAFRAPESLNIGQNVYCGKAADIWALGVTLHSLVYGNVPFIANSIPLLYEKIKTDPLEFSGDRQICDELKDCIRSMLTKDPAKRITLPQLKEHTWVTAAGAHLLPTEDENCCLVQVSDEDINSVVRSIPKLDTLILIKTMLKKHSFGNPFASGRSSQLGGSRLERFVRAGRSNSAPGAYNPTIDRQHSSDKVLPSLSEHGSGSNNEEIEYN